jgi:hypothetical protein
MKKEGIRVVLAVVLSLVLLLGTVITADAKGPPVKGIIYTVQDWTPGPNGTVNLIAGVTWQKVNAFGIELGWEKWDVGSSAWVSVGTPNTWSWGYRTPSGSYGAFVFEGFEGSDNTTYRAYCQLFDRKGNPISAKKNGYRVSAQQRISQAELTITKVPSLATAHLDNPVSFNVTVTNDGPDELFHCSVHDNWLSSSANTTGFAYTTGTTDPGASISLQNYSSQKYVNWHIYDLPVGESAWVVLELTPTTLGTLTNFAEIYSSDHTDSNFGSDNVTVNLTVTDA